MRLMLIADVGGLGVDERWHLGDEAMLSGTLAWLRRNMPDVELLVASSSPGATAEIHNVASVKGLDFEDEATRPDLLSAVEEGVATAKRVRECARDWQPFFEALHGCDAVLFCGAGNLSSAFPNRLFERITVAHVANVLGKPYAFNAQTVGPLDSPDRALLAPWVSNAAYFGTRDPVSADLVESWGVMPVMMDDDTVFMDAAPTVSQGAAAIPGLSLTLHRSPMAEAPLDFARILRAALDVADRAGLELVFTPHFRGASGRWSDLEMVDEVERVVGRPVTRTPWQEPHRSLATVSRFAAVITTRYHPLVFAGLAGVPCVAISQDGYHDAKLSAAGARARRAEVVVHGRCPDGRGIGALVDQVLDRAPSSPTLEIRRAEEDVVRNAAFRRLMSAI